MKIIYCDELSKPEAEQSLSAEKVGLAELMRSADYVSLHVPAMPSTFHLIDTDAIGLMGESAFLINTSRGPVVDTAALCAALRDERIAGAALDVYEEEAGIFFHDISDQVLTDDVLARLMTFNNVVITSHQAFLTHEALTNIADPEYDYEWYFLADFYSQPPVMIHTGDTVNCQYKVMEALPLLRHIGHLRHHYVCSSHHVFAEF